MFFAKHGYQVTLTDIADEAKPLIEANFREAGLAVPPIHILPQVPRELPFPDQIFDVCVSNQVLYYLDKNSIQHICREIKRILRPGGIVFFTMMGPKNYYMTTYAKPIEDDLYMVELPMIHRLSGQTAYREIIYLVRDHAHLADLFSAFKTVTIGYFDQSMFDMTSNFHWIFVGRRD